MAYLLPRFAHMSGARCSVHHEDDPGHAPTILIVEDEKISREALAMLLDASGYRSEPFRSAEEALEHVDHGSAPAYALVDLDLPGMSGLDLISRLERLRPQTVTILITAAEGERIEGFRRDHNVHYFRKPLDFSQLLGVLEGEAGEPEACYS